MNKEIDTSFVHTADSWHGRVSHHPHYSALVPYLLLTERGQLVRFRGRNTEFILAESQFYEKQDPSSNSGPSRDGRPNSSSLLKKAKLRSCSLDY